MYVKIKEHFYLHLKLGIDIFYVPRVWLITGSTIPMGYILNWTSKAHMQKFH